MMSLKLETLAALVYYRAGKTTNKTHVERTSSTREVESPLIRDIPLALLEFLMAVLASFYTGTLAGFFIYKYHGRKKYRLDQA